MELRITPQVEIDVALDNIRRQTDLLAQLQQEGATGRRILHPSDDPLATVQVLGIQSQNLRLGAYLSNIQSAGNDLNQSISALQEAGTILSQARQIATQASNSTNDTSSFGTLATQVDALLDRLLEVANTNNAGRYLFSGTASRTVPFVVSARDAAGHPTQISYQGGSASTVVTVDQGQDIATLEPGSEVFQQRQRGATVYTGTTGASAGTGTDSGIGQGTLTVAHTSTSYAAGSGIQPGTSSANGDTIIGPLGAHTLTIVDTSGNGSAGTISLDGGDPIAFTGADTDLKITGPGGEVVYVNTTGITAGFNGTVAITANGTLSTDGGVTTVPIDFTANQVVTSSTTGAVTNVNSSGIRQVGVDQLDYPGTTDVFQVLMELRDDLRNTRGLTQTQQIESISSRLTDLDRVASGISEVLGAQSAASQNLQGLTNRLKQIQLGLESRTNDLQGADVSSIVIGIQAQQNFLNLTLAAFARTFNQSLLDFLR